MLEILEQNLELTRLKVKKSKGAPTNEKEALELWEKITWFMLNLIPSSKIS